jgi:hypothetical protein
MNPYVTPAVAQVVIADRLAAAEAYRLAKAARVGRTSRKLRPSRSLPGRRHGRVELTWPDGVRSVVEVPRQPQRDDEAARGLAGNRR